MSSNFEDGYQPFAFEDIVERQPLTREQILKWNLLAGNKVDVTLPGELVEDLDGIPSSVGPSKVTPGATFTHLTVTRPELDATGLTPEEIPHVRIV
jgi:hypothetical protein